ncbi:hypothetical protein LSUE1_G005645 [Lachnellula suecica]|uniref:Aminoglycoside phosphotransferase domain-containing protein n=1 Tax=Lachnellula suecica TaxID=602035 RepID=A0A8T9C3L3_9HELO|nr:hypothetical protein LSUE1_G005645 [Lachnellula suecica]
MVCQKQLNDYREPNCIVVTAERKYFEVGNISIKRNLRQSEWQSHPFGHDIVYVPLQGRECILNEAAAIKFVAENTNVPVSKVVCCFEDNGAAYLMTEDVEGIAMDDLNDEQREIVERELRTYIETLHNLKSKKIGGPSGLVVPPIRATYQRYPVAWELKECEDEELVFCHNNLSQADIIVDPETLKIVSIGMWEFAGFYPSYFEAPFFTRDGPSFAIDEEVDDTEKLLEFLHSHQNVSRHDR